MAETISFLRGLPRYEVFLEEAKAFPGFDPTSCYSYLQLLRVGNEMLELDEAVLASHGTGHSRFTLLMMLLHSTHEQLTPATLAAKAAKTRATVSGLLDGLERDGLIERRPDELDRRLIRVHLTQLGRDLIGRIKPAYSDWFISVMSVLTEDEREQLSRLLQRVHERLTALEEALLDSLAPLPS